MAIHPFFMLWIPIMLAIPVLIALVIVWAVRNQPMSVQSRPTPPPETPLDILARRFAAGEITAEEYQKARDLLQGGKPPAG